MKTKKYTLLFEEYVENIDERFLTIWNKRDMEKYKTDVWDILVRTYKEIGGMNVNNVNDFIEESEMWKLVKKNGKIVAIKAYKDKHGRKGFAAGSDGTVEGKKGVLSIFSEDIKHKRAWVEVSGAPEVVAKKLGGQPLPNTMAAELTGKKILRLDPDGFHYDRIIGGKRYTKMIIGHPQQNGTKMKRF